MEAGHEMSRGYDPSLAYKSDWSRKRESKNMDLVKKHFPEELGIYTPGPEFRLAWDCVNRLYFVGIWPGGKEDAAIAEALAAGDFAGYDPPPGKTAPLSMKLARAKVNARRERKRAMKG